MPARFLHRNRLISFLIFIVIVLFLPISGYSQGRTHFDAGSAAQQRGDFDAALESFTLAIQSGDLSNANLAVTYTNRGLAYGRKGDNERAIQDYNEAIRLNPNYALAYSGRGRTRFFVAQFQAAQEDFKKALELNPTYPYDAIWLYLARARAGQDGRAELAASVERLKFVGVTKQIVSLFLGKTTTDDLFLAAKSPDPKKQKENLCEAQYYAGQHVLLRGKKSEARKLFSTAVESCPAGFVEYFGAKAELKRLK
jgi:lipoprotein NlpI